MTRILICILLTSFFSCQDRTGIEKVDFSTTKELQKGNVDVISLSRKRDRDIVDHLYKEALEKDPNLKSLEKRMIKISGEVKDSLEELNEYVEYSRLYYGSARNYIGSISDSTKRKTLTSYFDHSSKEFNNRISEHVNLEQKSFDLQRELFDQKILLKLIVSEKLIQSYQNDEPSIAPIKSINKKIENLIKESKRYTPIDN